MKLRLRTHIANCIGLSVCLSFMSILADPERPVTPVAAETTALATMSIAGASSTLARELAGVCGASTDSFRSGFEAAESNSAGSTSLWSDPASWSNGVPTAGSAVTISAGRQIVLDVATPVLGNMLIEGTLLASDSVDFSLQAKRISVRGPGSALIIGCSAQRYTRAAQIVLHGANLSIADIGAGQKGLLADSGATLSLYGQNKRAWTKLGASVNAGGISLPLIDAPTGWQVGDQIIVAPSGLDASEYDLKTIAAISGNQVTLSAALAHPHWGTLQSYGAKVLDERAAVGLLTRNIVIEGAGDADAEKLGAHVMVMAGANAQIDGVEFRSVGQARHPGRYAFHWHLAGERPNDFIRNSSVHGSFQRAIVVHQTNGVTVQDNVAFNISNHAFVWAEDGNEVRNRFIGNLGVYVRSPEPADFAFPIANTLLANTSQAEFRAATFWGRSFSVTMTGNIAAGSVDGIGFFFDRFSGGLGVNEGSGLVFSNNIAHAHYRPGAGGVAAEIYPELTTGHGLMVTTGLSAQEHVFSGYTGFKNYGGAWLEDRKTRLLDAILADNGAGVIMLRGVLEGSVIVGQSMNSQGGMPPRVGGFGLGLSGGVHVPSSHGGARAPIIVNTQIINQRDAALSFDTDGVGLGTRIENVILTNTPQRFAYAEAQWYEYDYTTLAIEDPQGMLRDGTTPTRWFKRRSGHVNASCTPVLAAQAYACNPAQSMQLVYRNAPSRWTFLTERSGAVHGLPQPWYFDSSLDQSETLGTLANGAKYDVQWLENAGPQTIELMLSDSAGKSAQLSWPSAGAATLLTQNGTPAIALTSIATLQTSASTAQFYDAASGRLRVKLVGASGIQTVRISAPFQASSGIEGRLSESVTGLVPGFQIARYPATTLSLRNAVPGGAPITVSASNAVQLDQQTLAAVLPDAPAVTVLRGYVNAPESGIYTFSAPAGGGSVDVYIGDQWATGSIGNAYPVLRDPDPNTTDESGRFALQQGLHAITLVYARSTAQAGFERAIWLRWQRPNAARFELIPLLRTP
jgi:hypothetical protein